PGLVSSARSWARIGSRATIAAAGSSMTSTSCTRRNLPATTYFVKHEKRRAEGDGFSHDVFLSRSPGPRVSAGRALGDPPKRPSRRRYDGPWPMRVPIYQVDAFAVRK